MQGLGALLMAWPAWRCVAWLRDRYAAKRSSELLLIADAIWLMQALVLASSLFREQGPASALAALLPWIAWRLTLHAMIRPVLKQARAARADAALVAARLRIRPAFTAAT